MPYAQAPVGRLRFRPPHPTNETWEGVRNAMSYGPSCIGYAGQVMKHPQSEDCLSINVVAPVGFTGRHRPLLPVGVYIYGGGVHGGASRDGRYNVSGIVSLASRSAMPFIAVTFNYRTAVWGFIASREVQGSGNLNLGLRDQRLALHWVQENIAAFGGDPRKVTLWGGSSGATHVGLHLAAYGGRDDGLFRAAIMQSGSTITTTRLRHVAVQATYDKLISRSPCSGADDTLDCLRGLSTEEINAAYQFSPPGTADQQMVSLSIPAIDGDFVPTYGSLSLKEKRMVKVPILTGITSNEGFNLIPVDMKTWDDMAELLQGPTRGYDRRVVELLLSFYPKASQTQHTALHPPIYSLTDLETYNRAERLLHDLDYGASKRLLCSAYSRFSICYSYRFDAYADLRFGNPHEGVRHSAEIPLLFQNFDGMGFVPEEKNPFEGRSQGYFELAKVVGLMWAGFITQLNPNAAFDGEPWPRYSAVTPRNIVFNETMPYYWTEPDTVRKDATDYVNSIQHSVLQK